ncbi:hypothetical protein AB3N04_11935 [Alkalihalophilus sp. As8PL]|uniref:Uncharacterized protein n=1 Tax=Alkalihalophilus sp. As8PL TaxID=3237103 RepID=A0AB39BNR1_9BACI
MGKKSERKKLKSLGKKLERELNTQVHKWLDHPLTIQEVNDFLEEHVDALSKLREYSELVAQQLNLPTKDDMARIAKLIIQLEEKIDTLEEKVMTLSQSAKETATPLKNLDAASPLLKVNPHITDPRHFLYDLQKMVEREW